MRNELFYNILKDNINFVSDVLSEGEIKFFGKFQYYCYLENIDYLAFPSEGAELFVLFRDIEVSRPFLNWSDKVFMGWSGPENFSDFSLENAKGISSSSVIWPGNVEFHISGQRQDVAGKLCFDGSQIKEIELNKEKEGNNVLIIKLFLPHDK